MDKPRFLDIPQFPKASYEVTVGWDYLEHQISGAEENEKLDLNPDFQRAHVWTRDQQRAYVEYQLQGGEVGRNLTFNSPGWGRTVEVEEYVIVDGKQRLEAVRAFLRDEFPAFGHLRSEYEGRMRITSASFNWRVCSLNTKAEVLRLYLNINAGGTPHTKEELDKVRRMLEKEDARSKRKANPKR